MKRLLALAVILPAALAAAEERASFSAMPGGVVAVSLPTWVLQKPVVKKQLASGLTTTFVVIAKMPHAEGRGGGARIEIRYDLWDEVYIVRRLEFDNHRDAQRLPPDQLERWWRTSTRLLSTPDDRVLLDVELVVLPFSAQEQRDAREWLSRSGGAGAAQSTVSGGLVDALIGTTINARPIISFRWSADVMMRGGR